MNNKTSNILSKKSSKRTWTEGFEAVCQFFLKWKRSKNLTKLPRSGRMPPLILKCRTLLFWTARWWKKSHVARNKCWNLCPQKLVTRGHDRRVSASTGGNGWVFGQFLFSTCSLPFCCGTTQIQQSRLPCFVSLYAWTNSSKVSEHRFLEQRRSSGAKLWRKPTNARQKGQFRAVRFKFGLVARGGCIRRGRGLSADPNDGLVSKDVLAPFAVPIFIFVLSEDWSMFGNDGG